MAKQILVPITTNDHADLPHPAMHHRKSGRVMTDQEELVRRAAGLVPVLREKATQVEALRCVPQETIDDLCRADLLRAPLPERFGGLGLDFDIILTVAAELGRGCGSTAWCYSVWAADSWMVGMYPEQTQEEYWAAGANTLCASCLNPAGATSVTAVEGGYRLSGQWDFASGCDAATWTRARSAERSRWRPSSRRAEAASAMSRERWTAAAAGWT